MSKKTLTTVVALLIALSPLTAAFAQSRPKSDPQTRARNYQIASQHLNNILASQHIDVADRIPVNFPVPSYVSNVQHTSFIHSTTGPATASCTIKTGDDLETVFRWYQDRLSAEGWTVKTPSAKFMASLGKQGRQEMLDATRERQGIRLLCMLDKSGAGTEINITWVKRR
ncbi:MAG: hypothetical protein JST01_01070 [Cyanobacteria bacterium SZAS TMP-1]|nr:hypothetical protein [Cyanobacteria bacterium SZAS TMP-1]